MATVVAGSYERFVFGYDVRDLPSGGGGGGSSGDPSVSRSFTLDAHLGQCKSVAARGGFLASGGADDLVRVWHHNPDGGVADLGSLAAHEGSVTCLAFHGPSVASEPTRLVSGGVDGNLIIWSVGKWDALKTLKAHRGGVHSLSVHRTGAVAMTCGADACVAMWDMKKGRVAHKTKQKAKPDLVEFTPGGASYATVTGTKLTITSAETGAMTGAFEAPKRAMCFAMAGDADRLALLGCEGGDVVGYDARAPPTRPAVVIAGAHASRVKAMVVPRAEHDGGAGAVGGPAGGPIDLVTASSEGATRLWDLRRFAKASPRGAVSRAPADARSSPVAEATGGGRFTCMATMPTALPPAIQAAITTESARDRSGEKKRRKEEKRRRVEKARDAAARAPEEKKARKRDGSRRDLKGNEASNADGFEIVRAEDDAGPGPGDEPAARREEGKPPAKKKKKSEKASGARGEEKGGEDETLVRRGGPGFARGKKNKSSSAEQGGRSYEETATAARRKGSGAKKPTPSRGFDAKKKRRG